MSQEETKNTPSVEFHGFLLACQNGLQLTVIYNASYSLYLTLFGPNMDKTKSPLAFWMVKRGGGWNRLYRHFRNCK